MRPSWADVLAAKMTFCSVTAACLHGSGSRTTGG